MVNAATLRLAVSVVEDAATIKQVVLSEAPKYNQREHEWLLGLTIWHELAHE